MKKIISLSFVLVLMLCSLAMPASAAEKQVINVETYTEYFDDGSYTIVEIGTYAPVARASTTSGYKTSTHYNSSDIPLWSVIVYGKFTYEYGLSSKADSASVTVELYVSGAKTVSKDSYVSGPDAVAQATVNYLDINTTKVVRLSCDRYGYLT